MPDVDLDRHSHRSLTDRSTPRRRNKPFDASRYSTRFIALKFAYIGTRYSGYEHSPDAKGGPPSIEQALWAALVKARLISPPGSEDLPAGKISWEGCDYSKCGRTDRGVSAFGQVIGIRVRSRRPPDPSDAAKMVATKDGPPKSDADEGLTFEQPAEDESTGRVAADRSSTSRLFDPIADEFPYAQALNRLLPPDIRVLAWCPRPPEGFSARFSCQERQYRYFFTQPALHPLPGAVGLSRSVATDRRTGQPLRDGWLDIDAMRDAARKFEGLHDFRNLCKIDPSKQLQNFTRRIFRAEVRAVGPDSESAAFVAEPAFAGLAGRSGGTGSAPAPGAAGPTVYEFVLHGSAFLWHQVRQMVAILFLVGQGLEKPTVVDELLDVARCPRRPHFEMAAEAPLVLWDCVFPRADDPALDWVYAGHDAPAAADAAPTPKAELRGKGRFAPGGLVDDVWAVWRRRKMDEILAGALLNEVARRGRRAGAEPSEAEAGGLGRPSRRIFVGGDAPKYAGTYTPLMQRSRGESVETINARWLARRGLDGKARTGGGGQISRPVDVRGDHVDELNEDSN